MLEMQLPPPRVLKLEPLNFKHTWAITSVREGFRIPPSQPAPGSKRCPQGSSGGSAIDSRASFGKEVLLGIVLGDIFIL